MWNSRRESIYVHAIFIIRCHSHLISRIVFFFEIGKSCKNCSTHKNTPTIFKVFFALKYCWNQFMRKYFRFFFVETNYSNKLNYIIFAGSRFGGEMYVPVTVPNGSRFRRKIPHRRHKSVDFRSCMYGRFIKDNSKYIGLYLLFIL